MNTTKHSPPIMSAMLNTGASDDTPVSPSSETQWLKGLYGSSCLPL